MWISDIYLKLYIDADHPQRLAEARCANMTARVMRRQRLLQRQARVQRELRLLAPWPPRLEREAMTPCMTIGPQGG